MEKLQAFRKIFDPHLTTVLRKRIRASCALTTDQDVKSIAEYASTLTLAGGKRVRPYLAWTMYQACGGKKSRAALDAFVALELFHVFGLIHDDIIDSGTSRHGIPTTHLAVATRLSKQTRRGDLAHVAEGQALLLGDALFAWVTQILHASIHELAAPQRAATLFYNMVDEVVIGQMLDVELMTRSSTTSELVQEKMRLKTASYTFVRPMQIGAALAGSSLAIDRFCKTFGNTLGLAFQIQDDLFDLTLTEKEVGKTAFSDLANRQHTVFTQYIFDHGTRAQKKELADIFGAALSEKDRPRITTLLTESGALIHGQRHMNQLFHDAAHAVERVHLPPSTKHTLLELVASVRNRTS